MKHLAIIPLILLSSLIPLPSSLSAAVPLRWTVETSRAQPTTFEAYQGETLDLEASLQSYGKPLEAPLNYALYWQTNGMGSAYWSAPVNRTIEQSEQSNNPTNVLRATWSPEMDVGARAYNCFIGLTGSIFRAAFQLRLRPSPGAVPNVIDQPPRVLDLEHTIVINPPWPTDATIDARIRRVIDEDGIKAPVETNVVTSIISNTVTKSFVEDLGISGGGSSGVDTNAVRDIALWPATNYTDRLVGELASNVSAVASNVSRLASSKADADYIPPAISNATGRIDADLTAYVTETYDDWTPSHTPIPELPRNGDTYYSNPIRFYESNGWTCERYEWSDDEGRWMFKLVTMSGDYTNPDATELTFPDGTKTYRKRTVTTKIATTNDLASSISPVSNKADDALSAANDANVWSSATHAFMTGGRTNCWWSGTNYVFGADAATRHKFAWEDGMDAATVPCSMALYEIRDGVRECVWDQKNWTSWYWEFKARQMEAAIQERIDSLGNVVTNDAMYAWAKRYASDGVRNPDPSTTFIDTPTVTLSPGMRWETVATVSGASYWTIVGDGAVIGGSGTNATLQIRDFEGNEIMTVTKGEHRLAWLERGEIVGQMTDAQGRVCFDMLADAQPTGYFSTTLDQDDFVAETSDDCPASYEWEDIGGGKWRVHFTLKPGIQANSCFAKFMVEIEGQTIIRYNAGQDIQGGLIYNGVKIAPDVSGSPAVGTVIQWKVVH